MLQVLCSLPVPAGTVASSMMVVGCLYCDGCTSRLQHVLWYFNKESTVLYVPAVVLVVLFVGNYNKKISNLKKCV